MQHLNKKYSLITVIIISTVRRLYVVTISFNSDVTRKHTVFELHFFAWPSSTALWIKSTFVSWLLTEKQHQQTYDYQKVSIHLYKSLVLYRQPSFPSNNYVCLQSLTYTYVDTLVSCCGRRWVVFIAWRSSCFGLLSQGLQAFVSPHPTGIICSSQCSLSQGNGWASRRIACSLSSYNSEIETSPKLHSPISFNHHKAVGLISICLSFLSLNWFWIQLGQEDVIYWLFPNT